MFRKKDQYNKYLNNLFSQTKYDFIYKDAVSGLVKITKKTLINDLNFLPRRPMIFHPPHIELRMNCERVNLDLNLLSKESTHQHLS